MKSVEDMDLRGKTCLITGATGGIGLEVARALARQGATVVGVGRSPEKCAAMADEIRRQFSQADVEFLAADLSTLAGMRAAVSGFNARHARLDVLVNNAGAMYARRRETADGLEMTFALNHLSYFLVTHLLLSRMSMSGRIVNVASNAHHGAQLNFDDLQSRSGYTAFGAYARSKLANLLFTYELARRLAGSSLTVNALHPGFVASDFAMNNSGLYRLYRPMARLIGRSPEAGARTPLYLAASPDVDGISGKYFDDRQRIIRSSAQSYNLVAARRLWEASVDLAGLPASAK